MKTTKSKQPREKVYRISQAEFFRQLKETQKILCSKSDISRKAKPEPEPQAIVSFPAEQSKESKTTKATRKPRDAKIIQSKPEETLPVVEVLPVINQIGNNIHLATQEAFLI